MSNCVLASRNSSWLGDTLVQFLVVSFPSVKETLICGFANYIEISWFEPIEIDCYSYSQAVLVSWTEAAVKLLVVDKCHLFSCCSTFIYVRYSVWTKLISKCF